MKGYKLKIGEITFDASRLLALLPSSTRLLGVGVKVICLLEKGDPVLGGVSAPLTVIFGIFLWIVFGVPANIHGTYVGYRKT